MFGIINDKEIYKQLSKDTEEVCQIIMRNNFKDELMCNQNYNVMLICYHLLVIVYIKIKNKKNRDKAEEIAKKIVYETIIRMPQEYEEILLEQSSNIITKFMAISRSTDLNLSTEISKGLCTILTEDNMYFMKDKYKTLIAELKKYFDIKIESYNGLI